MSAGENMRVDSSKLKNNLMSYNHYFVVYFNTWLNFSPSAFMGQSRSAYFLILSKISP